MAIAGARSPRDCALIFAVPSSIEAVRADLLRPKQYDYAKAMRGPVEILSAEGVWNAHFRPVIDAWKECRGELTALGVTVVEGGTSSDLRRLLNSGLSTVTILGHWKGHEVLPADVLDPAGIAKAILSDDHLVATTLRSLLGPEIVSRLATSSGDEAAEIELSDFLTKAIQAEQPFFDFLLGEDEAFILTMPELCELNRGHLDHWLGERLVAGNRLELGDGLWSAADIAPLIPETFTGCLHLANCHSSIMQRKLSSPARRVLGNEDIVLPLPVLAVYSAVVSLLEASDLAYPELWLAVLYSLRFVQLEQESGWKSIFQKLLNRFN